MDALENAVVILLVAGGSLAALSLFVLGVWVWLADDPFGMDGVFK